MEIGENFTISNITVEVFFSYSFFRLAEVYITLKLHIIHTSATLIKTLINIQEI